MYNDLISREDTARRLEFWAEKKKGVNDTAHNAFKFAAKIVRGVPAEGKEMKMQIVLDPGAIMPQRAHDADAGLDLFSREDAVIHPNSSGVFDTGVHVAIPRGYTGFIKSKSSLNVVQSCQSEGVIDSGYTGSIKVKLFNHGTRAVEIKGGQKISQLVILPIITPELELVTDLEKTERGNGGFGSTGKF